MEIKLINSKRDRKKFIDFYRKQYRKNTRTRDSLSRSLEKIVNKKAKLCDSVYLEAIAITEDEEIIMSAILAQADRMSDVLQIAFFESSSYSPAAFKLLLDRAYYLAGERGATKISASLNLHVNYGLGFLHSDYDKDQSFGMPYNPEFYHNYFENHNFLAIDLISYKKKMDGMNNLISDRLKSRLDKRYRVRTIDFKRFEEEINLYTDINNQSFKEHLFYYRRDQAEDLELFKDLKLLLKEENLLFVEKDGQAVGFMLWYPDFNQLIKKGKSIGLETLIKNKLFSKKIDCFKIVEIGVIPSERDRGAILALFEACFQRVKGRFENFESSWILDENNKSKAFGIKWSDAQSKKYRAYIKELQQ
nr:hypothetical protein [Tissierella sp.]